LRNEKGREGWFRQHPGYQTRINAILRAYMNAQ
jgi:uncharacterized protein (DUF4415 family)